MDDTTLAVMRVVHNLDNIVEEQPNEGQAQGPVRENTLERVMDELKKLHQKIDQLEEKRAAQQSIKRCDRPVCRVPLGCKNAVKSTYRQLRQNGGVNGLNMEKWVTHNDNQTIIKQVVKEVSVVNKKEGWQATQIEKVTKPIFEVSKTNIVKK